MNSFTHPSEERKRRGICGKVCFDKKTAQTKKNFLEKLARERLRVYSCPSCNCFHLTKKLDY